MVHDDSGGGESEARPRFSAWRPMAGRWSWSWWEASWDKPPTGPPQTSSCTSSPTSSRSLAIPATGMPPMTDSVPRGALGRSGRSRVRAAGRGRRVRPPHAPRPLRGHPSERVLRRRPPSRSFSSRSPCASAIPRLYQLLAEWYHQDPAAWEPDEEVAARAEEAEEQYTRHAIEECSVALRAAPQLFSAPTAAGPAATWDLGEFDRAIADWSEVIRLTDGEDRVDAFYVRGTVHLEGRLLRCGRRRFRRGDSSLS